MEVDCVVEDIKRLNDEAVAAMSQQGRQEDSLRLIQKALGMLRTVAVSAPSSLHASDCCAERPTIAASIQGDAIQLKDDPTVDSVFAFCSRTFSFEWQADPDDPDVLSQRDQNAILSVLLYNLSSVHHHLGLSEGRSADFINALKLYQLTITTMENISADTSGFDDEVLVILLCCLYNQMGHIHAYFQEVDETKFCLEWIQSMLYTEEPFCSEFYQEEYSFFHQYLLLSPQEQFSLAPAA